MNPELPLDTLLWLFEIFKNSEYAANLFDLIFDAIQSLSNHPLRARTLTELAAKLPRQATKQIEQLIMEVSTFSTPSYKKNLLCVLADKSDSTTRYELLCQALDMALLEEYRMGSDRAPIAEVVTRIQSGESELIEYALKTMLKSESRDNLIRSFNELTQKLPQDSITLWSKAWEVAQACHHLTSSNGEIGIKNFVRAMVTNDQIRSVLGYGVLKFICKSPKRSIDLVIPYWSDICRGAKVDELAELYDFLDTQKQSVRKDFL